MIGNYTHHPGDVATFFRCLQPLNFHLERLILTGQSFRPVIFKLWFSIFKASYYSRLISDTIVPLSRPRELWAPQIDRSNV